ncbi:hypothetical protein AAY81_06080 [Denitrobacterium detoxificans]|uniref:WxL domain surface cell wall-binding n=1 Tax=Denitrobacterium detoxificans TaxID=79604 RepID=A0A172RYJ7_9ACTN|nr:hypothetical protein [Denitrobacterium detoxificans]ANE22762.1 hypothetical protein AAY81_06080 [Denitrobacterium detoxificans]SEO77524.1 hypothetical protein SAMN02910314_01168 [Denitrobacterium detoxificans]
MKSMRKKGIAFAVAAVCAFALMIPALAFADPPASPTPSVVTTGGSGSSTQLNLITDTTVEVTNDSTNTNMKVLVPVAINFVANGSGTITGPSGAELQNYSMFPVHVSNVLVTPEGGVTFDGNSTTTSLADHVKMYMQAGNQQICLGDFVNNGGGTLTAGQWDIGAASGNTPGSLSLSFPDGQLGAFGSKITPFQSASLGTITWTVAAGAAS